MAVSSTADSKPSYPVANCLSYEHIKPSCHKYISALSATVDPVTYAQAVQDPKWCTAMNEELRALENNGTWQVTSLPHGKVAIGYKRIYKTKLKSNGTIE